MTKKISILFILAAAFFFIEAYAAGLPVNGFPAGDPVPGADEQFETDKAEALRRLDALIESIRSYAKRRHALSDEQDRAGAAQLKNELKSLEDFIKQKKLSGYSDIDSKYREAFLLNDQFNLAEALQDIWDLKKEIEAFNAVRGGYSFDQEEQAVKRFEDEMKKIEKFAKDVCNKYDAEEGVANEMRKARDLLYNYVSPVKADTLRELEDLDRRILEFNRLKHTYTEAQRNNMKTIFENAIKEKEAIAKSRRFDGDKDFRDLLKQVKEHLNDDRTPISTDMDELYGKYNRMSKPLSVADINIMKNEIGVFQSKYGNALKQSANRGVSDQFNSLCDKIRQAMTEQLGIEKSYRQIKTVMTSYEANYKSFPADQCRKAIDEIQSMIDNFKKVFKNTSTQNFVSWFTGEWINGDDYTAYKSDIDLIENKLKDYRKEIETGKPSGQPLQNIPTAAELDRELESVKQTLERAVDRLSDGKNSQAETLAKEAVSQLFKFKNSHMKKIEDDYRQLMQNPMQLTVLERDPYFYGKLKQKFDDYQRLADKVAALIAGEAEMIGAIRNYMTLYEQNVRWNSNTNERRKALDEIKRLIEAFKGAFNKSWDEDLALIKKLNFSKLKDVYDKYKAEIDQINRKIDQYWNETHSGGMTPIQAFDLLKREFTNYESQVRNKKPKQEMLTAIDQLDTFTKNFKNLYNNILKLPEYIQIARELDRLEQMVKDYRDEARAANDTPVLYNYTPQQQVMRNRLIADITATYTDINFYKERKDRMSGPDKKLFKDTMDNKFRELENRLKMSPFKDDKEVKDGLKAAWDNWKKVK